MAKEPEKKDERKDKAKSLYDSDRSKAMRKEREGGSEDDAGEKPEAEPKPEPDEKPTKARDKTEGGEPKRKPGEAKPDDGMAAMMGGHKAERMALHARQEAERLKAHGDERREHRDLTEQHEAEMTALRHAA